MRLSELLGRRVVDSTGREIGGIADVVVVDFEVTGLIVVERRHGRLFGYERDLRPALFRYAVRRLAGEVLNVPWEHVADLGKDAVSLRVEASEIDRHTRELRT